MIPGHTFTSRATTTDDTHTFYADIVTDDYIRTDGKLPEDINAPKVFISYTDLTDKFETTRENISNAPRRMMTLPFRFPVLWLGSHPIKWQSDIIKYNPDFTTSYYNSNSSMYMYELTLTRDLADDTKKKYNEFSKNTIANIIAASPTSGSNMLSLEAGSNNTKYWHNTCSLSIHAKDEGSNITSLYVSYVTNVYIDMSNTKMYNGINKYTIDNNNSMLDYITNQYTNKTISFMYSVPTVARYQINFTNHASLRHGFVFKEVTYPFADYSNQIDPSLSNKDFNTQVIPYQEVSFSPGTLELPSSNFSVCNSYLDHDNDRLVVVSAYDSPEKNSWPNKPTMRVAYYDISGSSLSFIPTSYDDFDIDYKLSKAKQYDSISNVDSVDITKCQGYYMISLSYSKGSGGDATDFGTLITKVNATGAPTIEYYNNYKNATFGGIQGMSNGEMT